MPVSLAGNAGGAPKGAYIPIANYIVTTTGTYPIFTGIPQTYTDLVVVCYTRGGSSSATDYCICGINQDSSAIHSLTFLRNTTSSYTVSYGTNQTYDFLQQHPTQANASGLFGSTVFEFFNYTSSNYKTGIGKTAGDFDTSSGTATLTANLYSSTSAITSLSLANYNGYGFVAGSAFYLYGVRRAGQ